MGCLLLCSILLLGQRSEARPHARDEYRRLAANDDFQGETQLLNADKMMQITAAEERGGPSSVSPRKLLNPRSSLVETDAEFQAGMKAPAMMTKTNVECVSCQYFLERVAAKFITGAQTRVEQTTFPGSKKADKPKSFIQIDSKVTGNATTPSLQSNPVQGNSSVRRSQVENDANVSSIRPGFINASFLETESTFPSFGDLKKSMTGEGNYGRGGFLRDYLGFKPGPSRFIQRPNNLAVSKAGYRRTWKALEEVCSGRLTAPYLNHCMTLMQKYVEVTSLMQTNRADEICQRIGMCTPDSYIAMSAHAVVVGLDAGKTKASTSSGMAGAAASMIG
eukprot:CAMPEP_0197524338 /NCGR_PEP_ID=MMETSP1318-20131121/9039_1 /TAXON_ID=552666 /ORGANISM="Partenskyella glossopodia, Strain RCC365" /LENGTH=334 /DNA_ID=CAMNT_0043077273 /DNA_START=108 /DNA_END=1112 /DNA_ORIENTATION=+